MTEVTCSQCGATVRAVVLHADQCGFVRPSAVDQELKPCGHYGPMVPWPPPHNFYLPQTEVRDRPCPHDPDDRLAIIKHRGIEEDSDDEDWLITQVERLRGRLRELEWAGRQGYEGGADPACPVCESIPLLGETHDPDCWLAAELRSTSP